ncbi:MAG: hypothetical protein GC204_10675 [Chloroflexi bacterium]|nr:hypothetical protein [Chloroflexota bacterium]
MPGQTDEDLMRLLNFDSDDLKLNREGQLSIRQRLHLLTGISTLDIFFIVVLPIGFVGALFTGSVTPIQALVAVVLVVVLVRMSRISFQIIRALLEGKVEQVSGTITIRLYPYERGTFEWMTGQKFANGIIDGVNFVVPVEMESAYQGKSMRVFYTSGYRQAVAAELLVR